MRRLRELPRVNIQPQGKKNYVVATVAGGQPVRFKLIEQRWISEERANELVALAKVDRQSRPLFVTTRLTPQARMSLRSGGVSWIERETGRCHLTGPGLLVDVDVDSASGPATGPKEVSKRPAAKLRARSALVAEALLSRHLRHHFKLDELTTETGLSSGLVSRVFTRLTSMGILEAHERGPKKNWSLHDAPALLDRWADEEHREPNEVTGLSVWSRSPPDLLERIVRLSESGLQYAIGGVAAANLYEPSLSVTPAPEIWIPSEMSAIKVADALNGQIVSSGANLWLWQTSGDPALRLAAPIANKAHNAPRDLRAVTLPRAYVEARNAGGRASDAAAVLRRRMNFPVVPVQSKD